MLSHLFFCAMLNKSYILTNKDCFGNHTFFTYDYFFALSVHNDMYALCLFVAMFLPITFALHILNYILY